MPSNYPASLDSLANPTPTTNRDDVGFALSAVISMLQNIAMALQAKLGIGASTPTNKTLLAGTGTGTTAYSASPTVSGSLTAEGGLNVGAATGAGTGDIKLSNKLYLSNQAAYFHNVPFANVSVAASGTLDLGVRFGAALVINNSLGQAAEVLLTSSVGSVIQWSNSITGFVLTDTGTTVAIYWDGSTYRIKNRAAGSQTISVLFRGA